MKLKKLVKALDKQQQIEMYINNRLEEYCPVDELIAGYPKDMRIYQLMEMNINSIQPIIEPISTGAFRVIFRVDLKKKTDGDLPYALKA